MKKTLCIFLTAVILLLTACNVAEPIDVPDNVESPSDSNPESSSAPIEESTPIPEALESNFESPESSTEASEPVTEPNESPSSSSGGYWMADFSTNNYDEYLDYIAQKKNNQELPDDFISYDMIKEIGNLKNFSTTFFPSEYKYIVIDKNGMEINVRVQSLSSEISTETIVFSIENNSLRNVAPTNNDSRSVFNLNNVSYKYYSSGRLYKIVFVFGGKQMSLGIATNDGKRLADYPLDGETTFVSQLLSLQTADAAVEAFNQKVEAEIAKNIADKQSKG